MATYFSTSLICAWNNIYYLKNKGIHVEFTKLSLLREE